MTRSDQILKATAAMQGTLLNQGYSNQYAEAFADGFHEGAAWADTNPQWHKYPEEAPSISGIYLVYKSDGSFFVDIYHIITKHWITAPNDEVIAWMKLPKPPKFD